MNEGHESRWYNRLLLPLWNYDEQRPRAFWRILSAVVITVMVPSVLTAVVVRPLNPPFALLNLLSNGIAVLTAVGVAAVWARYIDRRAFAAYGFHLSKRWWRMLILGVGVGVLGWGGALATDLVFGWASVGAVLSPGTGELPFLLSILLFGLSYVFVGLWEELVFRGIVMRNAIEGLTTSWVSDRTALFGGWILSSVLFGVLHFSQAASLYALAFWILAGLILGLAYLYTDQLALPIGIHFAIDISVNNIFGLANVRNVAEDIPMLIRPEFTGPNTLVGLSGVVNTAWLVIIGILIMGIIRWQYGSLTPRLKPYT